MIEETLEKTNLKNLSKCKGKSRAFYDCKTEIGGHLVSGHIHGVEVLKVINRARQTKDLQIKIPTS